MKTRDTPGQEMERRPPRGGLQDCKCECVGTATQAK